MQTVALQHHPASRPAASGGKTGWMHAALFASEHLELLTAQLSASNLPLADHDTLVAIAKASFSDAIVKANTFNAIIGFLVSELVQHVPTLDTNSLNLLRCLAEVLESANSATLFQEKHESLLSVLVPLARKLVIITPIVPPLSTPHPVSTTSASAPYSLSPSSATSLLVLGYETKRFAVSCLSSCCAKTGTPPSAPTLAKSAAPTSGDVHSKQRRIQDVQETVLSVLMDALNTDCVIDSPGVAGSVRVHEAYEKMIVAALKGTQLLLAENKHLLAMQCPQIVNRLHICIFAMGARFAASVPANVAGVDGSRTSRSTATRGRDKDEKARSNSVSSWRSRGAAASGGSDSEMSDVESVTHHERFTIEKVRLNALYTLQALAKAHSKLVYAKWPLFLARPSPLQMHPGPSLFSLTGHTVPRRVRLAAVLVIQAFLDGSKQYLAVAEGGKKETPSQTFTSLSQKLADTVTDVHVVLLALVAGEKDAGLRVALLKCLAVLVRNSPYARLTVQDLRREVFDVCLALRDEGDEAVCCAQLQVVHDLLDAGFSIPSEHTKQAVLEQFVKPHLSSGIEVKAVAALDLLSSLARNQVTSLDGEWESFVGPFVLRPILQSSGVADIIRVACFKFLEQHAGAAMELFNRKEGSEVTRIRWWSDLIETWVKPALSDSLFALRALALDTLAHVPPMCFQDLPTDLQLLCTDQLLYMLKDPNESVRSSCSATLGQFVTVEYFSRNTNFIDSLARRLAVLVGDADLLVRIRASWALANLADCVVTHSDVLAGVLDEELYRDLMASFVLFARDNEKCRSNGVRGIGGLLRIANQACVEIQVQDAIECICKNVSTGPFKVRWNACYAAYNLFNGVSLHRLKDASSHHNRLASLINALITALKTSKNYKVKINAAQALGVPTVYDNAAQIEQMIWVLREARGYLDDLSDTSFGEFKYRSQLDTQLKKSLLTLKVACRDLGQ